MSSEEAKAVLFVPLPALLSWRGRGDAQHGGGVPGGGLRAPPVGRPPELSDECFTRHFLPAMGRAWEELKVEFEEVSRMVRGVR